MNGARGWSRVRRSYGLTAVVTIGFVAVEALLLAATWLAVELRFEAAPWLLVLYWVGGLTVFPFVALWVLGYQGLRRGLGVAPILVGLGLWGSLWFLLNHREWVIVVALAVLPGLAALATHPCRRPVGSVAR
jgi:hypothetical protein